MTKFQGFSKPTQNYYKTPSNFFELEMTLHERILVLYIIRHTWGFAEYGIKKRISLDEFVHGRKRRDGTRLDRGTGLKRTSVKQAIKAAEEHGFITVETDRQDMGRISKYYMLRMNMCTVSPDDIDVSPDDHRSEKETIRKKPIEKNPPCGRHSGAVESTCEGVSNFPKAEEVDEEGDKIDPFDQGMSVVLYDILMKNESPLVLRPRVNGSKTKRPPMKERHFIKVITALRLQFGKERVESVIDWLSDHYQEEYTPKVRSLDDLLEFKRYEDAMKRSKNGKGPSMLDRSMESLLKRNSNGNGKTM